MHRRVRPMRPSPPAVPIAGPPTVALASGRPATHRPHAVPRGAAGVLPRSGSGLGLTEMAPAAHPRPRRAHPRGPPVRAVGNGPVATVAMRPTVSSGSRSLNAGSLLEPGWDLRRHEVVAWIDRLAPDVVRLQEIWESGTDQNTAGWICEHLADGGWSWAFGGARSMRGSGPIPSCSSARRSCLGGLSSTRSTSSTTGDRLLVVEEEPAHVDQPVGPPPARARVGSPR